MPMLVTSDEDFDLELSRLSNRKAEIVPMPKLGRQHTRETPESLRALIASDSLNGNGTAKEIANAYGVSQSSVNAYAGGATSTDRMVAGKLDSDLVTRNKRIGKKAQTKMSMAIDAITKEKLDAAKATDLSSIAANMAKVVDKTIPKAEEKIINNNIVFYSPQQVGPGNYEVIDVEAERLR